jgi:hypothetical protein
MNCRFLVSVLAVLAAAPSGAGLAAAPLRIPHFNVEPTCAASIVSNKADCVRDEQTARTMLVEAWPNFTSRNKRDCLSERKVDRTASYIEFLTCLWINENAEKAKMPNAR